MLSWNFSTPISVSDGVCIVRIGRSMSFLWGPLAGRFARNARSAHPATRFAELTPRLWKQHFAAQPLRSDLHRLAA
jgi:hypothetical protein